MLPFFCFCENINRPLNSCLRLQLTQDLNLLHLLTPLLRNSLLLIFCLFSSSVLAEDISRAIRTGNPYPGIIENYVEVGHKFEVGKSPVFGRADADWQTQSSFVNLSWGIGSWFVERLGEANDPYLFGYSAYNTENWSFDVVIGTKYEDLINTTGRLRGLDKRSSATLFGGRATGYIGDYLVQLSARQDISSKWTGHEAFVLVGRSWQVKNWNFHGMAGVKYFNQGIIDYYYGISEVESQRTGLDAYNPNGFFTFNAEFGVTYPITEHLVFRATTRARTFADEAMDSPIFEHKRSSAIWFNTSLSLVF